MKLNWLNTNTLKRGAAVTGGALGLAVATSGLLRAEPQFSAWSTPVPTVGGGCPIESRDGNVLYTASASAGSLDIWTYRRDGRNGMFEDRTRLGPPVSLDVVADFCPSPLTGNWLMFVSTRGKQVGEEHDACGSSDIFVARYRPYPPQSFGDATRLECAPNGPNTTGTEMSPSLVTTEEGTFLYFSSNVGGNHDIYRSEMAPDGSFGPGVAVASLNTGKDDQQPNVARDGLTIVFASNRDSTVFDIFMATRESLSDDWSTPVNLSATLLFPTAGSSETRPSLSWDLKRLYYGADGLVYTSERIPAQSD